MPETKGRTRGKTGRDCFILRNGRVRGEDEASTARLYVNVMGKSPKPGIAYSKKNLSLETYTPYGYAGCSIARQKVIEQLHDAGSRGKIRTAARVAAEGKDNWKRIKDKKGKGRIVSAFPLFSYQWTSFTNSPS